jgi:threonyl-tRNA synthetase
LGSKRKKNNTISVRKHSEGDIGIMSIEAFSEMISEEVKKDIKEFND